MIRRLGNQLRNASWPSWDTTQYLPLSDLIDTKGVASELGVSTRTIQFWQARGQMPYRQQRGKQLLYRKIDIAHLKTALSIIIHYHGY